MHFPATLCALFPGLRLRGLTWGQLISALAETCICPGAYRVADTVVDWDGTSATPVTLGTRGSEAMSLSKALRVEKWTSIARPIACHRPETSSLGFRTVQSVCVS